MEFFKKIFKKKKKGYLYLIGVQGQAGVYKIGITNNTKKRLATLQTGNPNELYFVCIKESYHSRQYEKFLHNRFKADNIRLEWFKLNTGQVKYIKRLDMKRF
jgi:hypothetical protein